MKFKATEDQVKQIAVNAIHASEPVGLGFMHFREGSNFSPTDITPDRLGEVHLDYVQGRMVKLNIWKKGDVYETRDATDIEYQSWARKYPTYGDLVRSVPGTEIIN